MLQGEHKRLTGQDAMPCFTPHAPVTVVRLTEGTQADGEQLEGLLQRAQVLQTKHQPEVVIMQGCDATLFFHLNATIFM